MSSQRPPRINLLRLGIRSVAMESLLRAVPRDVDLLESPSSARAAAGDFQRPLVIDGAVSPAAAATGLRQLGVVELLAERIEIGAALLVSGEAAVAMAAGRLDGGVRGLGLVPAQLNRTLKLSGGGVRPISGSETERAWFGHEYLFVSGDKNWSSGDALTGLLKQGRLRVCAFDPARSAGFGRAFVADWIATCAPSREEAA